MADKNEGIGTILVVDDEEDMQVLLRMYLEGKGFKVLTTGTMTECMIILENEEIDLVLLDINLPEGSSLTFLDRIIESDGTRHVIIISALGKVDIVVEAIKSGAFDYLEKPFNFERLDLVIKNAFSHVKSNKEIKVLRNSLSQNYCFTNIIGQTKPMRELFDHIGVVSNRLITVLISGESGTGKELVAKAIHFNGDRKHKPFVAVNCTAIPESLIESELFGHEKGSFTGALRRHRGKFEQANEGTIFLDEIGDMPLPAQARLLRFLQEREFVRVGGQDLIKSDVRVVAATNKDLLAMVKQNQFREDLYYRLSAYPITMPPLRERQDDIPFLVDHFLRKYRDDKTEGKLKVGHDAMQCFLNYSWPGNVRELENLMNRLCISATGNEIRKIDLPPHLLTGSSIEKKKYESSYEKNKSVKKLNELELEAIHQALKQTGGNMTKAAEILGVGRATLYRKLK